MYMMEMLEAYWYQIEKHRNIQALNGPDKFVAWAKTGTDGMALPDWERKFKDHALELYPELRVYIKELESRVHGHSDKTVRDLQDENAKIREENFEFRKANTALAIVNEGLLTRITELEANQKKPRKKKEQ